MTVLNVNNKLINKAENLIERSGGRSSEMKKRKKGPSLTEQNWVKSASAQNSNSMQLPNNTVSEITSRALWLSHFKINFKFLVQKAS